MSGTNPRLGDRNPELNGHADARFKQVAKAFEDAFLARGADSEVGASFAVVLDGEIVVDLWGGYKDLANNEPWQEDTLACCWSVSKSVCSTLALGMVDAGILNLDEPVCTYWPEFGQNGKSHILVRHVLEHRAPVVFVDAEMNPGDVFNWDIMVRAIESTSPNWPIRAGTGVPQSNLWLPAWGVVRTGQRRSSTGTFRTRATGPA